MSYIDKRYTICKRYYIDDSQFTEEEIIEMGKSEEFFCYDSELMLETMDEITPKENNGYSTIEIFNDQEELIYQNGN